jgi:hypothetical protein
MPITEAKASEVSHHCRLIWEYLAQQGVAPTTWKKCSAPAAQYYYSEIYKFHPDLRLCDGNWKAEKLAVDTYPGWHRTRFSSSADVKREVKKEDNILHPIHDKKSHLQTKLESPNSRKRKEGPTVESLPTSKPEKQLKSDLPVAKDNQPKNDADISSTYRTDADVSSYKTDNGGSVSAQASSKVYKSIETKLILT